ncbi:unnamed protein product [Anisakis simplex]|uniref:E2F-associated phosphoprotein n=1 Tax=Anisakis simplex TaxID=6269 RepID=A0A158PNK4_ANISI|nr:unnamed protein product [Anisakis simplex]
MERLKPFEDLDKDYYLDDHAGWGSDGYENCDSDRLFDALWCDCLILACLQFLKVMFLHVSHPTSLTGMHFWAAFKLIYMVCADLFRFSSTDEPREEMKSKSSDVLCPDSGIHQEQSNTIQSSDMDECNATMKKDDDIGSIHPLGLKAEETSNREKCHTKCSTSANEVTDSSNSKKTVCFKEGPDEVFGHNDDSVAIPVLNDSAADGALRNTADADSSSAYNDKNNLLKKLADKAMMKNKRKRQEGQNKKEVENDEDVQFYDPNEDDDNELWVEEHRKRLGMLPIRSTRDESTSKEREKKLDDDTDAVLSCPACLTLLTRQCQRHEFYRDQYRAVFVENCKVIGEESLFLPESSARKRKGKGKEATKCTAEEQPKPYTLVSSSEAAKLGRDDLFHPVQCAICSTAVGVYDAEEIYHFFNVLTGYA